MIHLQCQSKMKQIGKIAGKPFLIACNSIRAAGYTQQEFRKISMTLSTSLNKEEWYDIFKKLTYWELELERSGEQSVEQILEMQKSEANTQFFRFIKDNYKSWMQGEDAPLMSHNLIRKKVIPQMKDNHPTYLIVIDNLRYDQWKIIEPSVLEDFNVMHDEMYTSILPTATQYARNSIFCGMLPSEIQKRFPNMWKNDEDEGGKNMYEKEFLSDQLQKLGKGDCKISYSKITNIDFGKKVVSQVGNMKHNNLNVIVSGSFSMIIYNGLFIFPTFICITRQRHCESHRRGVY